MQLFGGLGDQLELLSLVLPWGSRHNVRLRLIAKEKRCRLLAPLLPDRANIEPFYPGTVSPFSQGMAIRLGVLEHDPTSSFTTWIPAERAIPIRTGWCVAGERRDGEVLLCSQPVGALSTGAQLLPTTDGAREPQTTIVDITAWRPWEMRRFQKIRESSSKPCRTGPEQDYQTFAETAVLSASTPLLSIYLQRWGKKLICSYLASQTNDGSNFPILNTVTDNTSDPPDPLNSAPGLL